MKRYLIDSVSFTQILYPIYEFLMIYLDSSKEALYCTGELKAELKITQTQL